MDVKHHVYLLTYGSVPFPPVSLQRQVVCLLLRPVFMCSTQERAYTVSWLVGVQIKLCYSNLWLVALHPCFQPASLNYSPSPLPCKSWRLRAGLEVEESWPTRRQCSGAVWRHRHTVERSCRGPLGSVAELSGTEAVRGDLSTELHLHWWLTCNNYSNRIQSFARCLQPRQPSLPTWRNAPRGRWCSSTLDGSWRMGSSVVGRLTNVVVPVSNWFFPAHCGLMSQERSGATPASTRGALWCHALGKRKGIWCLVWSFGSALCWYVNGLP